MAAGRVAAVLGALLLCAACASGGSSAAPRVSSAAPHPVAPDSLCAIINPHVVATAIVGESEAAVIAVPLTVQAPQVAGCEYANPAGLSGSLLDVTFAPVIQAGKDRFAQLQQNHSFVKLNVNGYSIVGNLPDGVTYLRFTDKNKTFASGASVDSILTVHFKVQSPDMRPLTAGSYQVNLAEKLADGINNGIKQKPEPVDPMLVGKPGPMLTDDQGRPVPNPAEVVVIYDELLEGDTSAFTPDEIGVPASDAQAWQQIEEPELDQAPVRASTARSMTVHPHCDSAECVYPDFAAAGWHSAVDRADGLKLGVDPSKVPSSTIGVIPPPGISASIFPPASTVGWDGPVFQG